jgi:copper chaperone CopZ
MTHTYHITGMTCAGCQYKVQHLLNQVEGIQQTEVNLEKGEATVEMTSHIPTPVLQQALKDYPKYQLTEAIALIPSQPKAETERTWFETYKPIVLIFSYLLTISLIAGSTLLGFDWILAMRVFMAGFFLTFSFFKILNLDGFADSYQMYDIIARKFKGWGYLYAIIELALGLAYATDYNPVVTNAVAFVVMIISIVGVLQTILNKRTIQCACLGAVFNLPMSTVTIIENGLMIAMSGIMLYTML